MLMAGVGDIYIYIYIYIEREREREGGGRESVFKNTLLNKVFRHYPCNHKSSKNASTTRRLSTVTGLFRKENSLPVQQRAANEAACYRQYHETHAPTVKHHQLYVSHTV